jgi:hypothetical protein
VNPADLYTKHLVSAERVAALVKLHGCSFASGRASSAPQTRTGQSGKRTIAEADSANGSRGAGELNLTSGEPYEMPHIAYDHETMNELYPSIMAPQNVLENEEHEWDTWDKVLAKGEQIVEEIRSRTISQGRKRCEGDV